MRFFLLTAVLLQTLVFPAKAQLDNIAFEHLTGEQGLSHGTVNCMVQDKEGFMWFGTKDGLNRYDGYGFQVYEHDPTVKNSLSDNTVRVIYEDRKGMMWIGTSRGLNQFDRQSNTFTLIDLHTKQRTGDNYVSAIHEDRSGRMWVTTSEGLSRFDSVSNTWVLYEHKHNRNAWAYNAIHTLYEDRSGTLWVGTNKGLSSFDPATGRFTRVPAAVTPIDSLDFSNAVRAIHEDRSGRLWLGTASNGLQQFDRTTHAFKIYRNNPKDDHSISNNSILSLCEDDFGNFWIGTQYAGLNRFDRSSQTFTRYLAQPDKPNSISSNSLITIYQDRFKVLWIGTFAAGLNKVDLLRKRIAHFKHNPATTHSISDNYVYALHTARSGIVWIGNRGGMDKFDQKRGTFDHYSYSLALSQSPSTNVTQAIYEDRSGNVWTGLGGGGLKKFNPTTQRFTSYLNSPTDSSSLPHNFVKAICEDYNGTIWVGTVNGLSKLDQRSGKFVTYKPAVTHALRFDVAYLLPERSGRMWLATGHDGLIQFSPEENTFAWYNFQGHPGITSKSLSVSYVYEDKAGTVWASLSEGGLYRLNRGTAEFALVSHPAELSKMVINGMLEDTHGNLWICTRRNGLLRYNPASQHIRHYDASDGLQGNDFNRALCQGATGEMYFGGSNGFNAFQPESIQDNPYAPPVAITGFRVFDQPRSFANNQIVLPYRDNFFSFDFAALNYAFPEKNQYAYQLEGFDKGWTHAGLRHYVSYTNVDPGEYVLRVKAANYDGVWNDQGTSVRITIMPPFWKAPWMVPVYGILLIGFLFGWRQYTISRERLKNNLRLKELESRKLQELDRMKSQFFTNVSHEFRTPLTLIINPLENILSEKVEGRQLKGYYQLMYRNAQRLQRMINQLLDLSKLEAGGMKLSPMPGDLIQFIQSILASFVSMAESQRVTLRFYHQPDSIRASFDHDKLEKILYNLLSNALKFTPEQGEVVIVANLKPPPNPAESTPWIEIQVRDTGIGIPADKLEKIFNRFFQVDSSHTRNFEGTGIGLSLAKELVDLHGGKISVSSENSQGSCFIVELPLVEVTSTEWKEVLIDKENAILDHASFANLLPHPVDLAASTLPEPPDDLAPLLLIVEDNADIRTYLRHTLGNKYRIAEAKDGLEGVGSAVKLLKAVAGRAQPQPA